MQNIYNMIWADAIVRFKKHNPDEESWKVKLLVYLSVMNSLNLFMVGLWAQYFGWFKIPFIEVNIFSPLDKSISFALTFALPFFIVNYFLIFHRSRYEQILKKTPKSNTNIALTYSLTTIISTFLTAIYYGYIG